MPTNENSSFIKNDLGLDRRNLLKGIGLGAVALAGIPLLAACGSSGTNASSNSLTLGSNASDDVPKRAVEAVVAAFKAKKGDSVTVNTVPHNDFQEKINSYLQGSPDGSLTWFAGYRMKYYAQKGLVAPLDDIWDKIGGNFSDALKKASTADDGKKYLVPNYNYPWGFFYRKSLWQERGYSEPKTFDELKTLCATMQKDGLIPIGFADKDGWPAMGTFDYLNMRLNGFQFHMDLCAHKESWDQKKVGDVFDTWKALLPYQDPAALGQTWQDAAKALEAKKTGMYLLGSFVTQQFSDPQVLADIEFLPFPAVAVEGQDSVEAPIDGLMLSKKVVRIRPLEILSSSSAPRRVKTLMPPWTPRTWSRPRALTPRNIHRSIQNVPRPSPMRKTSVSSSTETRYHPWPAT